MSLDAVINKLKLYKSEDITSPKGIGAQVYSDLVKEKIGKVIERKNKGVKVKTGILVANPNSNQETQHPIAIICEFTHQITEDVLSFTHQLCWNFCRAPLLVVIEPTLVRAFSCYESPIPQIENVGNRSKSKNKASVKEQPSFLDSIECKLFRHPEPIKEFKLNDDEGVSVESQAAIEALQWIELISGNFFKKEKIRFPREERADKTLLENLQFIREKLHRGGLDYDTIHSLLARLIFIQFLFQREDSEGQTAISLEYLTKLHEEKVFSKPHKNLTGILSNYNDAYKFFRLLNDRFNGDLFPGSREEAWQAEKAKVKKEHLITLADFISGKYHQETGQGFLWQIYSFDTIPLEFISSIYEEFVSQDQHAKKGNENQNPKTRETGVFYTKSHLVDFVLDNVLPWDGTEYDLKILDPSCGSGIFLVKAFQRLVQRWKNYDLQVRQAKRKLKIIPKPEPEFLSSLLENNLFGVDIDPHAVRVASFSLYLAMCDAIDPRTLWQKAKFPNLRKKQVVENDFFYEKEPLFKEKPDIKYDLIIGNAPWGKNTLKKSIDAQKWAKGRWETSNNDIGTLFLPRAASLTKENGFISLIQPALPLLTAQSSRAEKFRQKLFKEFKIEEIVNLSDLRFRLFERAVSPPCIVTMRPFSPDNKPINYICPKKRGTDQDYSQIIIEPMDVNSVYVDEAINKPWIWATLMWGSRRDVTLIERLRKYRTIETLETENVLQKRRGIYRPRLEGERHNEILDRLMLEKADFPKNTFLKLKAKEELKPNKNPFVSKNDTPPLNTFEPSQVFLKLGWTKENWRFQSAYVENSDSKGVLCKSAYYNIQSAQIDLLKSIATTCNSNFTSYYLFLTNGRCAFYRPEPSGESFWQVPIPKISGKSFEQLELIGKNDKVAGLKEVDQTVLTALGLNESEKILVGDHFDYTLRDYKGKENSDGRLATKREGELELTKYCETFTKVIKASFGQDKEVRATIFQEDSNKKLPVRMIAIHLDFPQRDKQIKKDKCKNVVLWERLEKLNKTFIQSNSQSGNIFYQRVVRIYDNFEFEGKQIPTVYLIKPDQKRYWLRSQALNDADEVSADLVHWLQQKNQIHLQGTKLKKVV